jgi:hypothetical protein
MTAVPFEDCTPELTVMVKQEFSFEFELNAKNTFVRLGMVAHACNPSYWKLLKAEIRIMVRSQSNQNVSKTSFHKLGMVTYTVISAIGETEIGRLQFKWHGHEYNTLFGRGETKTEAKGVGA